jgi:hypothetical protein
MATGKIDERHAGYGNVTAFRAVGIRGLDRHVADCHRRNIDAAPDQHAGGQDLGAGHVEQLEQLVLGSLADVHFSRGDDSSHKDV